VTLKLNLLIENTREIDTIQHIGLPSAPPIASTPDSEQFRFAPRTSGCPASYTPGHSATATAMGRPMLDVRRREFITLLGGAAVSQETLAEMIGTTRSRVSFFMNKFRKLGLIEYNGRIEVHTSLLDMVLHDKPEIATRESN
jgi:hypothetical protein